MALAGKLLRHPLRDIVEIGRLALILLCVDARLGLLPHSLNRSWLHRTTGSGGPPGRSAKAKIERIVPLSLIACRYRIRRGGPCLALALALRARFRAFGLAGAIVYGVRKSAPGARGIDAHAWLCMGAYAIDPFGQSGSFRPLA